MPSRLLATSRTLLHRLEQPWDRARFAVKNRLGLTSHPIIVPFRGYGDGKRLWGKGRIIENQGVIAAPHSNSLRKNLWLTLKRYETDEVPGAKLSWQFGRQKGELVTDEEGYFDFSFKPGKAFDPDAPWQRVRLTLQEARGREVDPLEAELCIRTPSEHATIGLISDIDDTIIMTGAWDFMKHWRTVVANSAESREVFPGVAPFYRALANGKGGPDTNPVFYVSSSPWNLFDLFERFIVMHDIPVGPLLLKDFGLTPKKWLTGGHEGHKNTMITQIMDTYPELRFVLVGDSGQHDAVIYQEIAAERPDRVAAVFIREVSGNGEAQHMADLRDTLARLSIPFASGEDLEKAAGVALDAGLITAAEAEQVRRAVKKEEAKA